MEVENQPESENIFENRLIDTSDAEIIDRELLPEQTPEADELEKHLAWVSQRHL